MIAIVVGRCDSERAAAKLADRFAAEYDRTYSVERITRSDFERRPFAVLLHEPDDSRAALCSLEVYRITPHGLRVRSRDFPAPEAPLPAEGRRSAAPEGRSACLCPRDWEAP